MATVAIPIDRVVVLPNTSWETYERLLTERGNERGTRFYYCDGELEIMVVSLGHDEINRTIAAFVELVAAERDIDLMRAGSTTFKREELTKGFEPDSCFYFRHAERLRGRPEVDLSVDPAPELVIEVDVTRRSLNRFSIFRALGVEEVWRYEAGKVEMFRLGTNGYERIAQSIALPVVTEDDAAHWVAEGRRLKFPAWHRRLQEWVRSR